MSNVSVECRSCGGEQVLVLELDNRYTDEDLRRQLDGAAACDNCGDQDWSVLTVDDA